MSKGKLSKASESFISSSTNFNDSLPNSIKNYSSGLQTYNFPMLKKVLERIDKNESNFQIWRPKGDRDLPIDEENHSMINNNCNIINKNQLIELSMVPLQGVSIYSFNTLKMKLEVDLLLEELLEDSEEEE